MVCYMAYAQYVLYLHHGGTGFQTSRQNRRPVHCMTLALHMLGIWSTYAIVSQAVAYRSSSPFSGPRLRELAMHMLSVCPTYPGSFKYLALRQPWESTKCLIALLASATDMHSIYRTLLVTNNHLCNTCVAGVWVRHWAYD